VDIHNINFGYTDGKNEAQESNFEELFYEEGHFYSDLKNKNNFIISGRKGSGKTTLAFYFIKQKESEKNEQAKMLFANDFTEQKLLSFSYDPVNREEMMTFWKYIFLLELGAMIVEDIESLPWYCYFKKKKVNQLKELLEHGQFTINEVVTSQSTEIQAGASVKFSQDISNASFTNSLGTDFNGSSKVGDTNTSYLIKSKYYESIKNLEKEVYSFLKNNKREYYLFYDDMDQLEEYMQIDDFKYLMKSMIYAADKMNHEIRKFGKSKVCLVLRSDIIKMLHADSNNLNKIISDFGIEISWFNPNVDKPLHHPLMQMILHKIKKSVIEYKSIPIEKLFNELFGDNKDILDFLMKRGLGRPRDVIHFLNTHKEIYPHSKTILFDELNKTEASYSYWFYSELMNEIKIDSEVEEIKKLINLIVERGYPTFKYKQIKDSNDKSNDGSKVSNLLSTLEKMRELGIIGVITKNGKMEFSYRDNLTTRATEHSRFTINYGLRKYLNL
jgi:Cdc6-like AAA superfamily ATPase